MELRELVNIILRIAACLSFIGGFLFSAYALSEIDFATALGLLLSGVISGAVLLAIAMIAEDLASLRAAIEKGHKQNETLIAEVQRTNGILTRAMQ